MNIKRVPLSEALNGFTAAKADLASTVEAVVNSRRQAINFRHACCTLRSRLEAYYHLCPLAELATRYLIFQYQDWSFVMWNDVTDIPIPAAYAISRATHCKAVAVAGWENCRKIELFNKGRPLREIHSQKDDGEWYNYESGNPLPFEDPQEERIQRRKDRFNVNLVRAYYKAFTGHPFPDWKTEMPSEAVGLDLFYTEMQDPIQLLPTFMDIREDGTLAKEEPHGPETTEIEIVTDEVRIRAKKVEMEPGISKPAWW